VARAIWLVGHAKFARGESSVFDPAQSDCSAKSLTSGTLFADNPCALRLCAWMTKLFAKSAGISPVLCETCLIRRS
jgi:hypothetical protein